MPLLPTKSPKDSLDTYSTLNIIAILILFLLSGVHHNNFDPANPLSCIENNPNIPRNCTITRPPPITKPCRTPVVLRQPLETGSYEDTTPEDNELLAKNKEYKYISEKMTWDPNCYECKVKYRDPKSKDLVMYLHAWRYKVCRVLLHYYWFCKAVIINSFILDHFL